MRSDLMKEGVSRAPHRSLLKALGVTDGEMKRPFVAVVSSKSDYIPGHTHLDISHQGGGGRYPQRRAASPLPLTPSACATACP